MQVVQSILWYLDSGLFSKTYDGESFQSSRTYVEKFIVSQIRNDHFRAFMGYGALWLAPSPVPATTYIPPTDKDLEILFQPMFDEYFDQSTDSEPVPTATVVNAPIVSTNTSVSTSIAQDAPSTSHSLSSSQVHPPVFPQGVAAGPTIEDTSITQADLHPSDNPVAGEPSSAQSTSGDASLPKRHLEANQTYISVPKTGPITWVLWYPKDNAMSLTAYADADHERVCQDSRRSTLGKCYSFLEINWLAGHQKKQRSTTILTTRGRNTCNVLGCCAQIPLKRSSAKNYAYCSIRFL
ncbi:hypothetical protein Tco_0251048 [Tanacetum coccineum]